jgi:hypothetical protein
MLSVNFGLGKEVSHTNTASTLKSFKITQRLKITLEKGRLLPGIQKNRVEIDGVMIRQRKENFSIKNHQVIRYHFIPEHREGDLRILRKS